MRLHLPEALATHFFTYSAEKDLATLTTLNPKLATELEHVIQTGNEE
jgi:hypothetical protein